MNNQEIAKLYQIRFAQDKLSRKNAIWSVICQNFIQKFIKSTDTVLDVACGYGEFINNIHASKKIGVDLNADTINSLNSDVCYYNCDAINIASHIEHNSVDVIFTSNFLEHLPNKKALEIFLNQILFTLKPGGKYLVLGPNLRYLFGQYWDYYDHHLGLTHLSLIEILKLKGFDILICIDRFLPFTTQGALPTHPFLVWLYLKFPFVWKFLGKQFFIVAQKPE